MALTITRVPDGTTAENPVMNELSTLADRIRERAYALFRERGTDPGDALEDWLQAERELTLSAMSQTVESDSGFTVTLALPGVIFEEIGVTALPDGLFVRAAEDDGGRILCQAFRFPAEIDPEAVTADFKEGVLTVIAPRAGVRPVALASAA